MWATPAGAGGGGGGATALGTARRALGDLTNGTAKTPFASTKRVLASRGAAQLGARPAANNTVPTVAATAQTQTQTPAGAGAALGKRGAPKIFEDFDEVAAAAARPPAPLTGARSAAPACAGTAAADDGPIESIGRTMDASAWQPNVYVDIDVALLARSRASGGEQERRASFGAHDDDLMLLPELPADDELFPALPV